MAGWSRPPADPIEPSQPSIEDERPGPAVFEVAPLGRRRRLPDRAVVFGVLAAVVVGLAVLKPWDGPLPGAADGASAGAGDEPAAPVPASAEPAPPIVVADRGPLRWPTWADVVGQVRARDEWGVRVLTDTSGEPTGEGVRLADGSSLASEWVRAIPNAIVRVGGSGPVRLIGITSPLDEPVLDVRIWSPLRGTAAPARVAARRLPGDRGLGEWLLLPPEEDREWGAAWSPGPYRFELLLADRVAFLDVMIPGPKLSDATVEWLAAAGIGRVGSSLAAPPLVADAVDAPAADPAASPVPVAVTGPIPVPVPAPLIAPMDERESWLDAVAGERPSGPPAVGVIRQPDVGALGVAVPPGTVVDALEAVRLGGVPGLLPTRRVVDPDGGRVIVLQPDGAAGWLPGIYRIDVAWHDAVGGRAQASYHVDLEPTAAAPTPRLLAAVRGWARYAGSEGIVTGTVEPLEGGPATAAIRLRSQAPSSAPETVEALGGGCADGGVLADTSQPVIGIAHRAGAAITSVDVERLFERGRELRVPVRAVIDAVPGLVVLTPADGTRWAKGWYRIVLRDDDTELRHVVCLGPGPGTRAEVPAEAGSRQAWAVLAGRRR